LANKEAMEAKVGLIRVANQWDRAQPGLSRRLWRLEKTPGWHSRQDEKPKNATEKTSKLRKNESRRLQPRWSINATKTPNFLRKRW